MISFSAHMTGTFVQVRIWLAKTREFSTLPLLCTGSLNLEASQYSMKRYNFNNVLTPEMEPLESLHAYISVASVQSKPDKRSRLTRGFMKWMKETGTKQCPQ